MVGAAAMPCQTASPPEMSVRGPAGNRSAAAPHRADRAAPSPFGIVKRWTQGVYSTRHRLPRPRVRVVRHGRPRGHPIGGVLPAAATDSQRAEVSDAFP